MKILLMIDNTVLKEYVIDQNEIIIGRDANCDICIDNIVVSRQHARIAKGPDNHFIEDLGSKNGTFVNGHWVSKDLIDAGDEISIGKYTLKICFENDPMTTTTAVKKKSIDDEYTTYRMGLPDFEKIFQKRSK